MKQLSILFKTDEHISGLVLRVTLALVMLPHGCQLLFGWFGGFGFSGSMDYFTRVEGLPWMVGCMVIMLQSFGALFILFGLFGRLLSLAMTILFLGMIVTSHWQHGFFMNWMGNQAGEGFEFHVLAIGLSLAIAANGSGACSIDSMLTKRANSEKPYFDLANIYQ